MLKAETEMAIRQIVTDIEDATGADIEYDSYEPYGDGSATITIFARREIGGKIYGCDYHFMEESLYTFWDIEFAMACIIGDVIARIRNAVMWG